jgi:Asp/Glu/hydantoin racemase
MDVALAERDVVEAGRTLMRRHPQVGAIVLECTNMPPYAAALREAVGVPVFDIYSLVTWLHAGIRPLAFPMAANRGGGCNRMS